MATVSDRVYSELPPQPELIAKAFKLEHLKQTASKDFCNKYVEKNIQDATTVKKQADLTYANFILDTFRPHNKLPRFNRKQKKLTSRQLRKLRMHNVPKTGQKYSNFLKLHHLWLDYMQEVLKFDKPGFDITNKGTRDILLRADYHGCHVKVIQSKCPTYVGESGIIIQETREVFKIINSANIVKIIPKTTSIFMFRLGSYEVKIYGQNFNYRPMERVAKKFKAIGATLDL